MEWDSGSGGEFAKLTPNRLSQAERGVREAIDFKEEELQEHRRQGNDRDDDYIDTSRWVDQLYSKLGDILREIDYRETKEEERRIAQERGEQENAERARRIEEKLQAASEQQPRTPRQEQQPRPSEARSTRQTLLDGAGVSMLSWFSAMGREPVPERDLDIVLLWKMDVSNYLARYDTGTRGMRVWVESAREESGSVQFGGRHWLPATTPEEHDGAQSRSRVFDKDRKRSRFNLL